jgi:hypothetical protein
MDEAERIANLRRRAAIWAHEYHDEATADWFADWYAVEQPQMSFNTAFADFDQWRAAMIHKAFER